MADNQSDAGSLGRESNEDDEGAIPKVITEEFFAELTHKTNAVSFFLKMLMAI